MIAACTLFDSLFSVEGWLCWESINRFDPTMKFYVLCLDQRAYYEATSYMCCRCGDIVPIRLFDFENYFKELLDVRSTRSWGPYTQTCKVFLPTYIFEVFGEQSVFYVDSDLYFWSNASQIGEELGENSFMVTSRELEPPPPQGRFNGGCFACKNDQYAAEFLKWWQEKTIEWCQWGQGPEGRFGEEGYLNIIHDEPEKFKNTVISSNPGINLAPWNLNKHTLERIEDGVLVDGRPLVCFHYQGMLIYNNQYESYADIRTRAALYIHDEYFQRYISFKEELLNGLDSYRRR